MSFFSRYRVLFLIIAFSGSAFAQLEDMEISGFRVPEYDEQGQMVYQLFGEHAVLGSGGIVKIEGVRVEFYRDGDVSAEVASPYCFYDRNTREVQSDAPVQSKMEGVLLSGTGYLLDTDKRTVHVLNESRVVFQDLQQRSAADVRRGDDVVTNETVITSKELFLNYTDRSVRFTESVRIRNEETVMQCGQLDVFFSEENEIERALAESDVVISNSEWKVSGSHGTLMYLERMASLEGDVRAKNKDLDLNCSKLNLRFDENNEIDWIEALGEVRIQTEAREAYAGRAVFDAITDEFLLEDNPKLMEGKSMLLADTIRFWRGERRMVCEPAARVVFYPDEDLEIEFLEK